MSVNNNTIDFDSTVLGVNLNKTKESCLGVSVWFYIKGLAVHNVSLPLIIFFGFLANTTSDKLLIKAHLAVVAVF